MSEPSAYVYRERGRVFVRMELDDDRYGLMREALADGGAYGRELIALLNAGEQPKHDRSEIMERFMDAPPIG